MVLVSMGDEGDATIVALERLYRGHYQRFFRVALAVLGNREAAADAVQEAFVRAIKSRFALRDAAALEAWVWRTVMNVAVTQRAVAGRTSSGLDEDAERAQTNGHAEELRELRAAVAALPERQRMVLFLRHYADLDYDAIAELLGIARGTVAATLSQAHAALRKTIEVPR
jgi:RNA polymerase sigma-70 factor, ECF subfamily